MNDVAKIILYILLPSIVTVNFIIINKSSFTEKISYSVKQLVIGVSFGLIAILCTNNAIQPEGIVHNAGAASVLTAGLVFGAPAGIIAGIIAFLERLFAVYTGIGKYTRLACIISSLLVGFYAADSRKRMFDDDVPNAALAFTLAGVMEVFHLSLIFLTNLSNIENAMSIIKTYSIQVVVMGSVTAFLPAVIANIFYGRKREHASKSTIPQIIQIGLLISVVVIFGFTTVFNNRIQTYITDEQVRDQLNQTLLDIQSDVEDATGSDLLEITREIAEKVDSVPLEDLAKEYNVLEINIIGKDGIIEKSTNPEYIDFDMRGNEQSEEFLSLLHGSTELVQKYGPRAFDKTLFRKYAGVATRNGFVQVGYGPDEFQDNVTEQIEEFAKNKHVGKSGYLIVADQKLNVVFGPKGYRYKTLAEYDIEIGDNANTLNEGVIGEQEVKYMYSESEGYYFISVMPMDEGYRVVTVATYVNVFMEVIAFAVLFLMVYNIIRSVVVSSVNMTNTSLARIIDGDLDEVVEVENTAEFSELSTDINLTVNRLKGYIAQAEAKIDEEIQYAKSIQENALPHIFPNDNKYEIYALMEAAKGVGGDFYDFYKTTRHGVNFLIADVSGKGIPGAMFMMRAKTELHTLTETGIPVNEVFSYGNDRLCEGNEAGMFVTAWEGNINLETGKVTFANAGHNPPVVIRADGTVEYLRNKSGFVLAGMDGMKYKLQELQLEPGDIIFLYTDGVVEATNKDNELYGEDRLLTCLRNTDKSMSMEYLCCDVIGDVGRFVGNAEQFDDITMLALKYKGNNPN